MITVDQISKSFNGSYALTELSFEIPAGSLCGLVGPNGAGKSTLFRIIMGLVEANCGTIAINNTPIHFGDVGYKINIGYAPETPLLYDYLTGEEFMRFIATVRKLNDSTFNEELDDWARFFNMQEKLPELIRDYSQGMRRKLSLMAALIGKPSVLLLYEATNGLDPADSYAFKGYLKSFCAGGGTVLFASHIIETVEQLCDRVMIIHQGRLIRTLTRRELKQLPAQGTSLEQIFMESINRK